MQDLDDRQQASQVKEEYEKKLQAATQNIKVPQSRSAPVTLSLLNNVLHSCNPHLSVLLIIMIDDSMM